MNNIIEFEIEKSLGFSINRASIILRKRLTIMLKDAGYNITPEEFSILSRLWEEDGISQSELVDKTIKDKSRVTRLLGSLFEKSYVYKETQKEDRRNQIVYLTESGRKLKTNIVPIVLELLLQASDGINQEDIETTQKVLSEIFKNLNKLD